MKHNFFYFTVSGFHIPSIHITAATYLYFTIDCANPKSLLYASWSEFEINKVQLHSSLLYTIQNPRGMSRGKNLLND